MLECFVDHAPFPFYILFIYFKKFTMMIRRELIGKKGMARVGGYTSRTLHYIHHQL